MLRSLGISLALAIALGPSLAHAERVAPPLGRGRAARVRVRPPRARVLNPFRLPAQNAQHAQPAMREVRGALRALGPEVQRCTDSEIPLPGRGLHRRLRLRVWLLPTGRWTLEVPELEGRNDRSAPHAQRRAMLQIFGCLNLAVARQVGRFARPFRSQRRQKVERAFRVTVPGPPPTAAALVRRVRARRAQLIGCVPGASRRSPNRELVVRATLGTDGSFTLRGLAVPSSVPFDAAARCVAAELAGLDNPRVTAERAFEAVVRFHLDEPTDAGASEL